MVAPPLLSVAGAEVYVLLASVTDPVGVGLLPPPLTATVTVNGCVVRIFSEDGVTVTAGVAGCAVSPTVVEMLA